MILKYFTYLCLVGGSRQQFHSINTAFSSLASSQKGEVFLCNNPDHKPGLQFNLTRSVLKQFDCVGLTKPQSISKLLHFCYLRFYAAILSNVAKLTTLKKKAQAVFSQYPKWQLTCKNSIDNQPIFCLVSVVKKNEKNFVFCSPSIKRGFNTMFFY